MALSAIIATMAGAAFLEAAGPLSLLAPGEVVIVAAAAALGLEPAALGASGAAVALAALAGSGALYLLTRAAGGGRWPRLARALDRALPEEGRLTRLTRRGGAWLLVGGRFIAVGRAAIPILAARARIPLAPFTLWTAVGTVLWSVWLLALGATLGRSAEALFPRELSWALAVAVAAIVGAYAVLRSRRRRVAAKTAPAARDGATHDRARAQAAAGREEG